jgi:hypothetical protein
MPQINKSGLAIVFSNPAPQRETKYPDGWLLFRRESQVRIYVSRDTGSNPRILRKEAA